MTSIASIRNFQSFSRRRRNKMERMTADIDVCNRLFDLRHVARDTLATRTIRLVMRVRL